MNYFENKNNGCLVKTNEDLGDDFNKIDEKEYQERSKKVKRAGKIFFKFEGNEYPTTKEDQDGLSAVDAFISKGHISDVLFQFSDGSLLKLNKGNIKKFMSGWVASRQLNFSKED